MVAFVLLATLYYSGALLTRQEISMTMIFRTDSSYAISIGHVMRCLNLADYLSAQHIDVSFLCRALEGHIADVIAQRGYTVQLLEGEAKAPNREHNRFRHEHWLGASWQEDAEQTIQLASLASPKWMVVDHYGIDERWEQKVKSALGCRLMVIDDLADRKHDADILLDQNIHEDATRYDALLPPHCKRFMGPSYALLQPAYFKAENRRPKQEPPKCLFIFFSAADRTGETLKTLQALQLVDYRFEQVIVVCGGQNAQLEEIQTLCTNQHYELHVDTQHMAELISRADIAIGGGGVNSWERCYLHVPSLVISVADNQIHAAQESHRAGYIHYIGPSADIDIKQLANAMHQFINDTQLHHTITTTLQTHFTDTHLNQIIDHITDGY